MPAGAGGVDAIGMLENTVPPDSAAALALPARGALWPLSNRVPRRSVRSTASLAALAGAIALMALPTAAHASAACPGSDAAPGAATVETGRQATLCLINGERTARHLSALRSAPALDVAARNYSQRMVAQAFFSHVAPDGQAPLQRVRSSGYLRGARTWQIGENLAWGSLTSSTPDAIVASWMQSPGHRANMLEPAYREIGIGLVSGTPEAASGGVTVTTEYGRRVLRPHAGGTR
jgi:uncharacterized protein YkwD